ncbi:hypothetical protein L7F22_008032 [Adiantum nelumboides]|nr:hypothetical protein [Adiantum nelumboides]
MVMDATNALDGDENGSSRLKRVCVFCGAYSGSRHVYEDATIELGKELVKRNLHLMYGEPMNHSQITRQHYENGGGIEPMGEVVEVDNMHQRKAEMARLADAFVALPGGYGTWEEVLEQITWVQLGIHNKPIGLLNVDGYYDSLLSFLNGAVGEGLMVLSLLHPMHMI